MRETIFYSVFKANKIQIVSTTTHMHIAWHKIAKLTQVKARLTLASLLLTVSIQR